MAAVQRHSAVEPPPVEVVAAEEQVDGAARHRGAGGWHGAGGQGWRWFTEVAQALAIVTG